MRKYATTQLTHELRKDLMSLKYEWRKNSIEEVIKSLLKIRNIFFTLERDGRKSMIEGIQLYDKLNQGWELKGYRLKEEK